MPKILIVGGTSDIGRSICHTYAAKGYGLVLTSRKPHDMEADAQDYRIRYKVDVQTIELDLSDYWQHEKILGPLVGPCEGAVLVAGYLGNHELALGSWEESLKILDANYMGAVSVLNIIAARMKERGSGWIAGISSVAGDRGRASNFVYGSSKAGLTAYLSGLRAYMSHFGVHVITVKPGFVATKMVAQLPPTPNWATAHPDQVAKTLYKAQANKKNVVYVTWPWRLIMLVISHIPEFIFKRMKF
ncbi:MAG: SDR family oxidoreductase [Bacteroidetes bacterium]|jgi:short-subunit dehydrogenase|nr:SDR family oxidoreductase [Bacteroidota bacterium]